MFARCDADDELGCADLRQQTRGPTTTSFLSPARYAAQPVFALLGGIANSSWRPIHQFCEQNEIPGLFPETDVPDVTSNNLYTLYFHRGVFEESRIADGKIRAAMTQASTDEIRVVQIHDGSQASQLAKSSLDELLRRQPTVSVQNINVDVYDQPSNTSKLDEEQFPQLRAATHVVVWLDRDGQHWPQAQRALEQTQGQIYWSGLMSKADSIAVDSESGGSYLTVPFAKPARQSPDVFRVRRWLSSRRIYASEFERTQLNTYFTCLMAKHALRHMVADFDRDYFIEWAEHECESVLNPGVFSELSLGPGQRFAARLPTPAN